MFFKPLSKCSSCLSYVLLITFQPVTFVSIDNTTLFGNISQSQEWPFHLPQQTNTSAVTYVAVPSAALGITSAHTNVVFPSTTIAITSANSYCGYNICKSQKISPIIQMWFSSSTNKQTNKKVAITSATLAKNISHNTTTWQTTSANNIQWLQTNCDNNICHIQHPKSWPNTFKKHNTMANPPIFG